MGNRGTIVKKVSEVREGERGGRKLGLRSAVVFPRLASPGSSSVTGSSARATEGGEYCTI